MVQFLINKIDFIGGFLLIKFNFFGEFYSSKLVFLFYMITIKTITYF